MLAFALAAAIGAAAPASHELTVQVRRGQEAPTKVQSWFASLDRVLQGVYEVSELVSEEASSPTVSTARRILTSVRAMAQAYHEISGDKSALSSIEQIAKDLEKIIGTLRDQDPLPKQTFNMVFSLNPGSLHRWAHLMQQAALQTPGPKGTIPANMLVTVERGTRSVELAGLDVSQRLLVQEGRLRSPALRAFILSARENSLDLGPAILSEHRLWLRFLEADFFADLLSPGLGGMVRIRYEEPGASTWEQARFYFFTRVLYDLGFSVKVDNGILEAQLSAGRSNIYGEEMTESLVMALKALALARQLPKPLRSYLQDTIAEGENAERLEYLARIFLAEGGLPFLTGPPSNFKARVAEYQLKDPEREALRSQMNQTLLSLSLGDFPAGVGVGQRTVDKHYNAVLEAAIVRGEIRLAEGPRLLRVKGYDPLSPLASLAVSQKKNGTDIMELRQRLRSVLGSFQTIGLVGPLLAQRAQWRLDSGQLILYALRRNSDGGIEHLRAERGFLNSRPKVLDTESALGLLWQMGLIPEAQQPSPDVREPGKTVRSNLAPGEAETFFWGHTAHRGSGSPLTSRITYDRSKAGLGEHIYVTPYVVPEDREILKSCRALLTTAGGPLVSVLAAEAGLPALVLPQTQWSDSGIQLEKTVFAPARRGPSGILIRDVLRRQKIVLRENEAIRLDPEGQMVELLAPEKQAFLVQLEEALKAYDRSGDIQALALWTVAQLTASELDAQEKQGFAEALIAALESRLKTGISPTHLQRIRTVVKEHLASPKR